MRPSAKVFWFGVAVLVVATMTGVIADSSTSGGWEVGTLGWAVSVAIPAGPLLSVVAAIVWARRLGGKATFLTGLAAVIAGMLLMVGAFWSEWINLHSWNAILLVPILMTMGVGLILMCWGTVRLVRERVAKAEAAAR